MSDLAVIEEKETRLQAPRSTAIEAAKSRAITEIQAMLTIARADKRKVAEACADIQTECQRFSFAERALYSYPRGKETVSGPTIRLAEMLARNWGNLDYGFRELEQENGFSRVEAYCHDLQTNTRVKREFIVAHQIQLRGGDIKRLKDPRDIYEQTANQSQRRVRSCILEIIPGDIVDEAVASVKKTLARGNGSEPLIDRIKRIVVAFGKLGITPELLEKKLKHPTSEISPDEIVELQQIYNSIKDGEARREDWFSVGATIEGGPAAELNKSVEPEVVNQETLEMPNPFEGKKKK